MGYVTSVTFSIIHLKSFLNVLSSCMSYSVVLMMNLFLKLLYENFERCNLEWIFVTKIKICF